MGGESIRFEAASCERAPPAILAGSMRWSQSFLVTLREVPGDAEVVSHQLLYRAGMIQKLAAGIYSYTPFGFRSLRKMIEIVREEMDATGAMEVDLPILQPKELWVESGRWDRYVDDGILFHLEDRKGGEFALAPTAEEAVTDMVRRSVTSWRQLPFNLYQIRTKFRDEIRPRFGLLRGREFLMKDAYSFDVDQKGLDVHYRKMDAAYRRIFERCNLEYALVDADSGAIGGSASQEFMVVADTGEDALVFSDAGDYGANIEKAVTGPLPEPWAGEEAKPLRRGERADARASTTCEDQAKHLGTTPARIVKTMIYEVGEGGRQDAARGRPDPRRSRDQRGQAPQGARRAPREARFGGDSQKGRRDAPRIRRAARSSSFRRKSDSSLRRPIPRERAERLVRGQPGWTPPRRTSRSSAT